MPGYDLVIDYELLNTLAKDTERLKEQLADSRLLGRSDFFHKDDLGGAFGAVNMFLLQWTGPFDNAKELLEALSQTYKFAAQKMFETDAKLMRRRQRTGAGLEAQPLGHEQEGL